MTVLIIHIKKGEFQAKNQNQPQNQRLNQLSICALCNLLE